MFVLKSDTRTPAQLADAGLVFLRCTSHRARERLIHRDRTVQGFYSLARDAKGGFYAATADELPRARTIPGVSRARAPLDDLRACWG